MYNLTDLMTKIHFFKIIARRFKKNQAIGVESTLSKYEKYAEDSDDEEIRKPPPAYTENCWRKELMNIIGGYKHPTIVNGYELLNNANLAESPLYAYFDFVTPGKQFYCVNPAQENQDLYIDHALIKHRNEHIPHHTKSKTKVVERKYSHEQSVFANFTHDNAKMIKDCFDNDRQFYKVTRLRYKDEELIECVDYLRQNYHLFLNLYRFVMHNGGEVMTILHNRFM